MEQITGRIVKDAIIKKTTDGRELVAFSVVVNDRYKPKGKDEVKEARYFNCSYWLSAKVKEILTKGSIVSVFGKVNLNAYKGSDGEYHANLTFHTNHIEVLASAKRDAATAESIPSSTQDLAPIPGSKDDLPF